MKNIIKQYDKLQLIYGAKNLNSVYGAGKQNNPKVALVFMNPTKRNIATHKEWLGIKAQWLGTKQIWDFLTKCGIFSEDLNNSIKLKTSKEWTPEFCESVYNEVENNGLWITNLAKCSQDDARPLPDNIFREYKELLMQELTLVNPDKTFLFGNQVASIMLDEDIKVSTTRQKLFHLNLNGKMYDTYAIYYPVGNGRFNQDKAIEDIKQILNK